MTNRLEGYTPPSVVAAARHSRETKMKPGRGDDSGLRMTRKRFLQYCGGPFECHGQLDGKERRK